MPKSRKPKAKPKAKPKGKAKKPVARAKVVAKAKPKVRAPAKQKKNAAPLPHVRAHSKSEERRLAFRQPRLVEPVGAPVVPSGRSKAPMAPEAIPAPAAAPETASASPAAGVPAKPGEKPCPQCEAVGSDPLTCTKCAGRYCSACDLGGICPICEEPTTDDEIEETDEAEEEDDDDGNGDPT